MTDTQKEAIEYTKGPLLIIAGPGSGKTKVLVERAIFLIKEKKVHPDNILVTTFTIKSAEEIKSRIVKRIGSNAQSMQISTIHSFCQFVLESNPENQKLGGTFDVLDEDTQYLFVRTYYYRLGLKNLVKYEDLPKLISAYNIISENCIDPKDLIKSCKEKSDEKYLKLCESYKKYLNLLTEECKIDFAGLQKEVLFLLRKEKQLLKEIQNRFQYLLIDEYQDTNAIQAEIFKLIAGDKKNICVVGDEDQSIYGFRGANIDNFRKFEETYNGTKVINLETNFRSKDQIVSFADRFITPHRSFVKKLNPVRGKGNEVVLVRGTNAQNEAETVIRTVKELKDKKIIPHYGYITLLFKSVRYHALPFINELKNNNIEFEVSGAGGFLEREEIRTMLYLMAYVDPPDYEGRFSNRWGSWWNLSMFKSEVLKLNDETITKLKVLPKDFDISTLLTKADFNKIGIKDLNDIDKLKTLNYLKKELIKKEKGILEIFYEVIKRTKYFNTLFSLNDDASKVKLFNLSVLTQLINKYESIKRRPKIENFLWYLYSIPKDIDEKILENPFAVKVMTIHQAKGLEFPIVFICSVMKGRFPRNKRKEDTLIPISEELLLAKPESGIQEERRLFYVGMTRAQDSLILSTADKVNTRGGISPFIEEEIGLEKFQSPDKLVKTCANHPPKAPKTVKLSYSSMNTYYECPFRFQLINVYEFQTPAGFMQNQGIIIHNALHHLHLAIKRREKIDFNKVKAIVDKSWIRLHTDPKKDDNMREKLQTQLFYQYYHQMKDYIKEIVTTEEPFSLVLDEYIITGRIDLIIKNKHNEIELIDFKAMREEGVSKTNVELQLRVYEYALREKHKINKLCAYSFKDNKRTYFKPNREVLKDMDKEVGGIVDCIRQEKFPAKKNEFCNKCIFKFSCKAWGGY